VVTSSGRINLDYFTQFITSRGVTMFLQKNFNLSFALVMTKIGEAWESLKQNVI
jgi:hypothetical protein